MHSQLVTAEDRENYGDELISMTQRAAVEALGPELNALRAENQQLRHLQQRQQHVEIERSLDASVPSWRQIYAMPQFSSWLAQPDEYSGEIRSTLLRRAVANGDSSKVVAFYRGFTGAGSHAPAARQSRQLATGNKPVYTREQIKQLYAQRARGGISDANWAQIEPDIIAAASEGRINSMFDKYGNETRFR
jgi:hypothetical protein